MSSRSIAARGDELASRHEVTCTHDPRPVAECERSHRSGRQAAADAAKRPPPSGLILRQQWVLSIAAGVRARNDQRLAGERQGRARDAEHACADSRRHYGAVARPEVSAEQRSAADRILTPSALSYGWMMRRCLMLSRRYPEAGPRTSFTLSKRCRCRPRAWVRRSAGENSRHRDLRRCRPACSTVGGAGRCIAGTSDVKRRHHRRGDRQSGA